MAKTTASYWNPLRPEHQDRWQPVRGLEGIAEELTLSIDPGTGEYTRLTRFRPGADTTAFGGKRRHRHAPPVANAASATTTRKRSTLLAAGSTTRRSTCGWRRGTTPAGRRVSCMGRFAPTPVAWCWRCRSPTARRVTPTAESWASAGVIVASLLVSVRAAPYASVSTWFRSGDSTALITLQSCSRRGLGRSNPIYLQFAV